MSRLTRLTLDMSTFFAHSQYMPCSKCGTSVATAERERHLCDAERTLDYQMFQLREEVAGFQEALRSYLDSTHGRFEQWLAERERRASS